jgi:MFS family permease
VFTAVAGLASTFLAFGVSIVVSKLGGSPQHPVGNSLLAEQYPPERRGFAISAHIAGGNVGTVAVPVIGASLIALVGWGPTLVLFGVPAAVAGLAILWLVGESGSGRAAALAEGSARRAYGRVLRDRDKMLVLASSVVAGGARGLGVLNLFVPLYLALVLDLDTATIALMTTVLLIGSVPGPIVAGWLSDRLGRKPVIVGVYLLGAAAFLAFLAAGSDTTLVWGAIVLMSCFSFVESSQLQSLLADITVPGLRDAAFAVYFTIVFVAGALWVAAYGVITDVLGDAEGLRVVFVTMAAAYLLAVLVVLPIRVEQRSREAWAAEEEALSGAADPHAGGPY